MYGFEQPEMANTREYIEMKRAQAAYPKPCPKRGNAPKDFSREDASFHLHVLASGSKGNAAVVETPNSCVLIDCGITKKAFLAGCDAVGFNPARIQAVLVTHEHSDHTRGLGVVLRGLRKMDCLPKIYATAGTANASSELRKIASDFPVTTVANSQDLSIGNIHVQLLPTSHDAADPIGMVFETERNGHRDVLAYATDTGTLPPALPSLAANARLMALESNHDPHLLDIGPYPPALKRRVASDFGHLSNDQAAEALECMLETRLETVIGMHLSETNNLPRLASAGLNNVVARNGHSAQVFTGSQGIPISIG